MKEVNLAPEPIARGEHQANDFHRRCKNSSVETGGDAPVGLLIAPLPLVENSPRIGLSKTSSTTCRSEDSSSAGEG